MAEWDLRFHHLIPKDLASLPANVRERILRAIEKRLGTAPDQFGERLRQSLRGYWKLRVGDHRVIFELVGRQVRIYGILDRRDVYERIARRMLAGWPETPPRA